MTDFDVDAWIARTKAATETLRETLSEPKTKAPAPGREAEDGGSSAMTDAAGLSLRSH